MEMMIGLPSIIVSACWIIITFCLYALAEYIPGMTNPYLIHSMDNGPTQFLVFHGELRANYTLARSRCIAMGGELVDVDTLETLHYLAPRLHGPAYISGFLGDRFGEDCAAIYPGGAVAVPEFGCQSNIDSICEVPVLGTGAIHLGAAAEDYESGHLPIPADAIVNITFPHGTKTDFHVIPKGFFRLTADQGKQIAVARMEGLVTSTVTIFGSIATNPVLPCCKCCG